MFDVFGVAYLVVLRFPPRASVGLVSGEVHALIHDCAMHSHLERGVLIR